MTYQFKRNPSTIPVSKIICTCTTIFLKFYNKCVNKNESGHHSSAKNKTKLKHTKASFSTSAANGQKNKFDIF
jgi:hypothetical protein